MLYNLTLNPPQGRGLKVKNEVGALATSIIYKPKAFSIAEFELNFLTNEKTGPKVPVFFYAI